MAVSQIGFNDKARKFRFEIETTENIKNVLNYSKRHAEPRDA
jgi:hypothetical protein